jgi:hypothetical protein
LTKYPHTWCSSWICDEGVARGALASRRSQVRIPAVAEFTFHSDLLSTARGGSMWALLVEFACLLCYPGNTLCSERLEPPGKAGIDAIKIPKILYFLFSFKIRISWFWGTDQEHNYAVIAGP